MVAGGGERLLSGLAAPRLTYISKNPSLVILCKEPQVNSLTHQAGLGQGPIFVLSSVPHLN